MYRRRRSSKRKRELLKLGDFLGKTLKKNKIDLSIADFEIFRIWREAVGPQIAAKTEPFKFRNGILFVAVSNSAWLQQLQFMKQDIIERVNHAMSESKKKKLDAVYFSIGPVPLSPSPDHKEAGPEASPVILCDREEKLIQDSIDAIADSDLKELVKRVMTKEIINRRIRGDG